MPSVIGDATAVARAALIAATRKGAEATAEAAIYAAADEAAMLVGRIAQLEVINMAAMRNQTRRKAS